MKENKKKERMECKPEQESPSPSKPS